MAKVYLFDEFSVKGLIGDGKMLRFHLNGSFIEETSVPFGGGSFQEVDVISLLATDGVSEVEVGYNINDNFSKKPAVRSISQILDLVTKANGLIFMGRREMAGHFAQYLFIFRRGVLSPYTEL